VAFKEGEPYTVKYTVDGGAEQTALEIYPSATQFGLPVLSPTFIHLDGGNKFKNQALYFYAPVPDNKNHSIHITQVFLNNNSEAIALPIGGHSTAAAVRDFNPSDVLSGVFRNGIFEFNIHMINNAAKYSVPSFL